MATGMSLADPIIRFPSRGEGVLIGTETGPGGLSLVGEVSGIGVLGAERGTTLPGYGLITGQDPELGQGRVGLVGEHALLPLAFAVRVDVSEALRLDDSLAADAPGMEGVGFLDRPVASIDRFVDDASVWWTPTDWANVIVGRQKVPFSRFRQLEQSLLTAGVSPFLVDRVAPDRRWGATFQGDLGALGYALGGFADLDELELRSGPDDAGDHGRGIVALHTEWTPRAPIGMDLLATPTADPWYDTVRISIGTGVAWRVRGAAGSRFDLSLSGQLKYQRYSAVGELILSSDGGEVALGAAGEAGLLITDRVALFTRGDYDVSVELWSLGGGASVFVTTDRKSKLSLFAFARRDTEPGSRPLDGVIAQLQASL